MVIKKSDFCIIIPAVKKDVAFVDDLVKKLDGIPLVIRSILTAQGILVSEQIFVVTDSEEISLMCERIGVEHYKNTQLKLRTKDFLKPLKYFLKRMIFPFFENILILWPYTPLINKELILQAFEKFKSSKKNILLCKRRLNETVLSDGIFELDGLVSGDCRKELFVQTRSLMILKANENVLFSFPRTSDILWFEVDSNCIEIKSYQDWWICEKLLARKRIVFNIIGDKEVGMGHIFRSLAIAHEISAHEIVFVCEEGSDVAIEHLSRYNYKLEVSKKGGLLQKILDLKPDLLINDSLDTEKDFVKSLKNNKIKVVNFEDLGSGAEVADLTINDLYDQEHHPQLLGNIEWGPQNFFLRDEFNNARKHKSIRKVCSVLITFGGTDSNNLTKKVLKTILPVCKERDLFIYVVSGSGYEHLESFKKFLSATDYDQIEFVYSTGVMSRIMEKANVAISSNGRTVYELAHMGIPGIVISHHERENLHRFSSIENGYINLGVYQPGKTEKWVLEEFLRILDDHSFRSELFQKTLAHDFSQNKSKVVKKIERVFEL